MKNRLLGNVSFGFLFGFLTVVASLSFAASGPSAAYTTSTYPAGQVELINAEENHRAVNFIEVSGVKVTELLPDDVHGSQHQKWVVELANGAAIMAVYNIDVTPRLPLKVGDVISMGGQFIYAREGSLLHWLHEDGRGRRPNGYVEINGVRYGANGPSGIYKN